MNRYNYDNKIGMYADDNGEWCRVDDMKCCGNCEHEGKVPEDWDLQTCLFARECFRYSDDKRIIGDKWQPINPLNK